MITVPGHYVPTSKDLAGMSLELVTSRVQSSSAASILEFYLPYQVPGDRTLELRGVSMEMTPGAAQVPARFELFEQYADSTVGNDALICAESVVLAAPSVWSRFFPVAYFVRPGSYMLATGVFDAGANVNALSCTIHGVLVPRGNIQFSG